MATILTTRTSESSNRRRHIHIDCTVTGAYVTGGVPVDWFSTNSRMMPGGRPGSNPERAFVRNTPAGYEAELVPGTTARNWLLKIYTGGVEIPAAAFPAALLAATFQFEVMGRKGAF